jgi:hypothetical protein
VKHRIAIISILSATLLIALTMATLTIAQAPLPGGPPYTQDFNTLASSGSSSTVPTGWALSESGANANTTYSAGTGSSNTGDTYSFGTAPSDRAFGGVRSGNLIPTIGAGFTNNTNRTIGELSITYACEQWRLGTSGRNDRLDFQYSTNATSLTTGTWLDFDTLDCVAPNATGTVGALDGNVAANRITVTAMLTNTCVFSVPNGSTFWLRWTDFDATGADDGLGIDDFSMSLLSPNAIDLHTLSANTSAPDMSMPVALVGISIAVAVIVIVRRRSRTA